MLVPWTFDYYTKLGFSPAHKIHKIHTTSATAWSAQPASPEYGAGVRTAEPYAGERNGNSSARADLVAGRTGRGDGAEQVYCHGVHGSAHHHHVGSQSGPMELGCDRLRR